MPVRTKPAHGPPRQDRTPAAWDLEAIPYPWDYNPSAWVQRVPICLLASVAFVIATYMALYQWRLIDSAWDPIFGRQTQLVLDSNVSEWMRRWFLVPDAAFGAIAYLGDATIGANVNVGAGTITCNYDGEAKHPTTIQDGAFIGSDTQLIAPVTIGEGAYVGTGTTVRESVPPGALAVSAGKQRNLEGWVAERKKRRKGP